jgi:hypothetical protein
MTLRTRVGGGVGIEEVSGFYGPSCRKKGQYLYQISFHAVDPPPLPIPVATHQRPAPDPKAGCDSRVYPINEDSNSLHLVQPGWQRHEIRYTYNINCESVDAGEYLICAVFIRLNSVRTYARIPSSFALRVWHATCTAQAA